MPYELADASATDQTDRTDQIVITLDEDLQRNQRVASIDLFVRSMKIRFTAGRASAPEDVFKREIAQVILSLCATAREERQVINNPSFRLRLRGLTVDGCTVTSNAAAGGVRRKVICLRQAIGNALALFQVSPTADAGLSLFRSQILTVPGEGLDSDRLFDEMLAQLYLPLVNLNAYLRQVLDGQIIGRGESFSTSVVQLKTRAEAMQFAFDRMISEMMLDKYAEPPPAALAAAEVQTV